jgi:hypothetical protein
MLSGSALPAGSHFTVAIAAVYRFVTAGFKGYLGILTALSAFHGEHLPLGLVAGATASVTVSLSCLAARGAALGLIGIAPGFKELLLFSAEGKGSPAIGTLERFVLKAHWMTSSLKNSS